jgi:N-acetylglucosamine kinase-like BadF-type ATPase
MILKFEDFINESIKDLMKPKTEEEINEYFDKSLNDVLEKEDNIEKVYALFKIFTKNVQKGYTRGDTVDTLFLEIVNKMDKNELNKIIKELFNQEIEKTKEFNDFGKGYFSFSDSRRKLNSIIEASENNEDTNDN